MKILEVVPFLFSFFFFLLYLKMEKKVIVMTQLE